MNEKMSPFQMALFGILILLIVGGVVVFSMQKGDKAAQTVPITLWGTLPFKMVADVITVANSIEENTANIIYEEQPVENFEKILVDALAAGNGPDAVILSDDLLIKHENKLFLINNEFYTQNQFKTNFIEAGEVLLRPGGIIGFPFSIDPMVMYWNRTILNSEGISTPPKYWDDFLTLVPRLVKRESNANINRAVIPFGEYSNLKNAKDILVLLTQQSGNNIIYRNNDGKYESLFNESFNFSLRPANAALNYFVQFSNPSKDVYTWNKSMPMDEQLFLSGDLVFYFGYASERDNLIQKNPNLNFDVAVIPQSKTLEAKNMKSTNAKMSFIAIVNRSPKISNAFTYLVNLTGPQPMKKLSELTGLPSVRRDVRLDTASAAYLEVFSDSALFAIPFIDPDVPETDKILKNMTESIVIGNLNVGEAVNRASAEINSLLQ